MTHADGRQLQRLGIQPHVRVEPTIAGVRAGRDEVLEAAVAFLRDHAEPAQNVPQKSRTGGIPWKKASFDEGC